MRFFLFSRRRQKQTHKAMPHIENKNKELNITKKTSFNGRFAQLSSCVLNKLSLNQTNF